MNAEKRVTREALFDASRLEVWAALTEADRLAEWLGGEVEINPRPRGNVVVKGSMGVERRGRVVAANRPYRLVIEWWEGPEERPQGSTASRVEFVLQEEDGGTRLTVTEWPSPFTGVEEEAG